MPKVNLKDGSLNYSEYEKEMYYNIMQKKMRKRKLKYRNKKLANKRKSYGKN